MNQMQMGIYVHIPFCARKCEYCDFLSGPAPRREQDSYMKGLIREIQQTADAIRPQETVQSVFFGGGTPSLLEPHWIADVLDVIREHFTLSGEAEITVECNPGTLTKEKMDVYQNAGVNRISLGLQSSHDQELRLIGRIHTWDCFRKSYEIVRQCGIRNVNVDLMSGLPGQSLTSWKETLRAVTELEPEHISAYSLILEPGTPFFERYQNLLQDEQFEETDRTMYAWTKKWLKEKGYERYEISNYARPGKECRHNNFYWTGVPYLGFGIGAASFYRQTRYTNRRERREYEAILSEKNNDAQTVLHRLREEIHVQTREEQMEEFLFLGLRRMEGIAQEEFERTFSCSLRDVYGSVISDYVQRGFLRLEHGRLALTDAGIDVSNVILSGFLLS